MVKTVNVLYILPHKKVKGSGNHFWGVFFDPETWIEKGIFVFPLPLLLFPWRFVFFVSAYWPLQVILSVFSLFLDLFGYLPRKIRVAVTVAITTYSSSLWLHIRILGAFPEPLCLRHTLYHLHQNLWELPTTPRLAQQGLRMPVLWETLSGS